MKIRLKYILFAFSGLVLASLGYILIPNQAPVDSGPDFQNNISKSVVRDFQMMQERTQKRVPYEKMEIADRAISNINNKERDFAWSNIPSEFAGRGRALHFHQSSNSLFYGSISGGLWRNGSFRNDAAWQEVAALETKAISSIAEDPNDANILYVGTGEAHSAFLNYRASSSVGSGIWKSVDGGNSWNQLTSTSLFQYVNDIVVREENGASVVYAGVASGTYMDGVFNSLPNDGLYRSIDGGDTWNQVLPLIPNETEPYAVSDIEIGPENTLYVGSMQNLENKGGGVVLFSSDGLSWDLNNQYLDDLNGAIAGRIVLKAAPTNDQHVYAVFMSGVYNALGQLRDYYVALKQSVDGAVSFTELAQPDGWASIPWHAASLAVDPNDEYKLLLGGLDTYVLNDTRNSGGIAPWIKLSDWAALYELAEPGLSEEEIKRIKSRYVHADIHAIQFLGNSSDELAMVSDGGVFYTPNMSLTKDIDPNDAADTYPDFTTVNNTLTTTQFYSGVIHPTNGSMEVLGGTQDNGSLYENEGGIQHEHMISGGDGGLCFWDADDPELKITSVYGNRYFIHFNEEVNVTGYTSGLFVNPADYDDYNNLIYSNMATSGNGGLYSSLKGRFYDSLAVFNINGYLGKDSKGLAEVTFIKLNANLQEPITGIKIMKTSPVNSRTAVLGTELGKVYRTTGLPFAPETKRIDNNQLPVGYVSSLDFGDDANTIMVTLSNFGVESVWLTRDGGIHWKNQQRNLPDMPVRWGLFNPYDDTKIFLATERGVWGLENNHDPLEEWTPYNQGLPAIRVDMIDIRKSDSVIVAATHGRGIWYGKFDQGMANEKVLSTFVKERKVNTAIFPNPLKEHFKIISTQKINSVKLSNILGQHIKTYPYEAYNEYEVPVLPRGIYIISGYDANGLQLFARRVEKK